jgi:glycosyltransferase involved in cell wall biosynthesis
MVSRKKLCFVTASPLTLRAFMRNHLLSLAVHYDITAVADFAQEDLSGDWLPGVRLVPLKIERQISLSADLRALLELRHLFRKEGFDVVHSVTPKAGLLAMTAGRLARVPHRIHCFTGQVWVTHRGFWRMLLKSADKIVAANANHLLTDSFSQRSFLENEKVVRRGLTDVIGSGSISGVDIDHFRPDEKLRYIFRAKLGVPTTAILLMFAGRLNRDKGVLDLARAFSALSRIRPDIWLLVVGHDEGDISHEFGQLCGVALSRVLRVDYLPTLMHAMVAADILVLPSYREGFGSVVIEAAACGLPSVVSRIYGLTDAVQENVTGLMHPPGDVTVLVDCLLRLCNDDILRRTMGNAALKRAQADFSMHTVTAALLTYYEGLLKFDHMHSY